MIKISHDKQNSLQVEASRYLWEECQKGIVCRHLDYPNFCFTFYYPEDELAFVLKYGNDLEYKPIIDAGFFYCPYIPLMTDPGVLVHAISGLKTRYS